MNSFDACQILPKASKVDRWWWLAVSHYTDSNLYGNDLMTVEMIWNVELLDQGQSASAAGGAFASGAGGGGIGTCCGGALTAVTFGRGAVSRAAAEAASAASCISRRLWRGLSKLFIQVTRSSSNPILSWIEIIDLFSNCKVKTC